MSIRHNTIRRPVWLNVAFIVLFPLIALSASIWYGMNYGITWREISAAVFCWSLTAIGITGGYHRLFAHRGYKAHGSVRFLLAMLGAAAAQNSAIAWCSDHRYHHRDTDTDGDPYDSTRGFFYAHMGWILIEGLRGDQYTNVKDLRRDPILAFQHKYWLPLAFGVNCILVGLCALVLGRALGMVIIAGMLRVVFVQHCTFCINSFAHIFGRQPYSNATSAKDNWFLSLLTMGEGYHNYHHSFEWDYRNGPRWYNWDPTKWFIWTLSKVGLASDLRRTPMDIILKTRFEEGRRSFVDRMGAWGDHKQQEWALAIDSKREQLQTQREDFFKNIRQGQLALRDQLMTAEATLELSLRELKALRLALSNRISELSRTGCDDLRATLESEVRHLKRSVRNAQRATKASLIGWERLVRDYAQTIGDATIAEPA